MTSLIADKLTGLADVLADLKARVRVAVAGEMARAVSQAVQQVVQALVAGRLNPDEPVTSQRPRSNHWDNTGEDDWGRTRDSWTDDRTDDEYERDRDRHHGESVRHDDPSLESPSTPVVTTAIAAGVLVAKWWLTSRGTMMAAAGLGLGVGLLGVFGGPVFRTAAAVLAATADLFAATDALGDGASRLEHV